MTYNFVFSLPHWKPLLNFFFCKLLSFYCFFFCSFRFFFFLENGSNIRSLKRTCVIGRIYIVGEYSGETYNASASGILNFLISVLLYLVLIISFLLISFSLFLLFFLYLYLYTLYNFFFLKMLARTPSKKKKYTNRKGKTKKEIAKENRLK